MLEFSVNLDSITRQIDKIGADAQAAIRPAAQAAAQVYYEAVKEAAPKSKHAHWFTGTSYKTTGQKYWFESGSLKNAIYQVYSKSESSATQATYHIAWNHRKVPYGFMVAYGTKTAKANDFIGAARKSVNALAREAALATFKAKMGEAK